MKFIGIWIVYFGHMEPTGGRLYDMAWSINVPLFFIVSGMCENLSQSQSFGDSLKKNIVTLLVPFYFFAAISMIFFETQHGWNLQSLKSELLVFLCGGIRNKSVSATTLWFLSCLFSVRLMFFVIRKLKFRILIILVAALLYCIYGHADGINSPSLVFNLDSACGYLFYYVMGWAAYPLLDRCLASKSIKGIAVKYVLGLISIVYTVQVYIKHNIFAIPGLGNILRLCSPVAPVLGACIIVYLISLFAYGLQDIDMLSKLGTETLYYCGSETVLKQGIGLVIAILGLKIEYNKEFQMLVYTFLLLLIAHKYIVPTEKLLLGKFQKKITWILDKIPYRKNNNESILKVSQDG